MRTLRWTHPALGVLGLIALVVAGCRSNAQQDLVARELRMQEDQLYAMEDYISQYQQLVCKYRSENAALRQQLAVDGDESGVDALPVPNDRARPRNERRGPTFRAPETPQRSEPAPDDIQIQVPDIPPLEGSTSTEVGAEVATTSYTASAGEAASAAVAVEEPPHNQSASITGQPDQAFLHGEVIANDSGGGPRLMVDVERLDSAGHPAAFDGTLSLLLLFRSNDDIPQNLARWDFTESDVQSAAESSAGEQAMRFYLELPADTPILDGTELWVRLISRDAAKLLAHAPIDLARRGEFASTRAAEPFATPQPSTVVAESAHGNGPSSGGGAGKWTTARTQQLADLANDTNAGKWRASSEPLPVVQSSFATAPVSRPIQRAAFYDSVKRAKPARPFKRPTWSPERSALDDDKTASTPSERSSVSRRPVWSDTRD
jgi:hypothetical protein